MSQRLVVCDALRKMRLQSQHFRMVTHEYTRRDVRIPRVEIFLTFLSTRSSSWYASTLNSFMPSGSRPPRIGRGRYRALTPILRDRGCLGVSLRLDEVNTPVALRAMSSYYALSISLSTCTRCVNVRARGAYCHPSRDDVLAEVPFVGALNIFFF